jgi:hypothetical protein
MWRTVNWKTKYNMNGGLHLLLNAIYEMCLVFGDIVIPEMDVYIIFKQNNYRTCW